MILNKNNILTYLSIIKNARPKSEIVKYIYRRLKGQRKPFDKDVIITSDGVELNCGRYMENCTVACSQFEKEIINEIHKMEGGTFVDVGSHIGKFSMVAGKHLEGKENGYILAIEPTFYTASLLQDNISRNRLYNVYLKILACGKHKGTTKFFTSEYHPATNSHNEPDGDVQEIEVEMSTLDIMLEGNPDVRLIKIDVEGEELNVLKGAKRTIDRCHPTIIFEAWNKNLLSPIIVFLHILGYKVENLKDHNYIARWVGKK